MVEGIQDLIALQGLSQGSVDNMDFMDNGDNSGIRGELVSIDKSARASIARAVLDGYTVSSGGQVITRGPVILH